MAAKRTFRSWVDGRMGGRMDGQTGRWGQRTTLGAMLAIALTGCGSLEQALAPDPKLAGQATSGDGPAQQSQSSGAISGVISGSGAQGGDRNRSSNDSASGSAKDSASDSAKDKNQAADKTKTTDKASQDSAETASGDAAIADRPPLVAQDFPDVLEAPADIREQVVAVVDLGVIAIYEADIPQDDPLTAKLKAASAGAASEDADADATVDEAATTDEAATDGEIADESVDEAAAEAVGAAEAVEATGAVGGTAETVDSRFISAQGDLLLAPDQPVTRRQYARWLVAANNVFYGDRPSFKLRLAPESADPAFKDVSATDPDFAVIQGLAEAGILPSTLSGSQEKISFKPDAPLKREDLLLWKLPLDVRGALPASNLELVKEAWGFQDASKISAPAQRAVLADYQNGDLAIIRRVFGYTTLLQPAKPVTRAEAVAALAYFGSQDEVVSALELTVEPTVADPETIGG